MRLTLSTDQKDWLLVALAALVITLLPVWLFSLGAETEPSTGNDRFGLAFVSAADQLADETRYSGALATGARWDRWPLYWHWVAEGGYAGTHEGGKPHDYDTLVIQEFKHGFTPIVILMGTPGQYTQPQVDVRPSAWLLDETALLAEHIPAANMATSPPARLFEPIFADGSDEPGQGKAINPDNVWADFVFRTVERYRPGGLLAQQQGWPEQVGVRYWEIWNEPDYTQFWTGNVADYYRLLEVAYKTIKSADPQAVVLLGGLAFYEKFNWFVELLRQTQGYPERAYFDVMSFHHYFSIYDSENLIRRSRADLDGFGLAHIPIWITESGVSVWDDYPALAYGVPPDEPLRGTVRDQAAYIIQHSALAFYHQVERYFHFMLHDDCGDGPSSAYGLRQNFSPHKCNPAGGQPRPAYAAYQLAAQEFRDVVPLWRERKPTYDQVAFYRPGDASRVLVLWATGGVTATATIRATGRQAGLYWIEPVTGITHTTGLSRTLSLTPTQGSYTLILPPATNQNSLVSDNSAYPIGGPPYLLIEEDTHPPTVTLAALPPTSAENMLIRWQGQDPGSGVAGYDIWVSQDQQPLKPWLLGVTITQSNYTGQFGHTYGFAIRARDRAGNETASPTQAETTTQVGIRGTPVSGLVLDPGNKAAPEAEVLIAGPNVPIKVTTDSRGVWGPVPLSPGEYTFSAVAPNYSAWPAPRRLTITTSTSLTLTLAPLTNNLTAGDFEGDKIWGAWDWAGQVNQSIEAFDGQVGLRLGDNSGEAMSCPPTGQTGQYWAISQAITLPPEAPRLSFMYKISTTQPIFQGAWFEVSLWVDEQKHNLISPGELWQATDWRMASIDLSPWSGQPGIIQFQVARCSEHTFRVSLDRMALGASPP
jgi:hypothetical protein